MHELIVSPFLGRHFVLRPGHSRGLLIPAARFGQLREAVRAGESCPAWLVDAARSAFHLRLAGRPLAGTVLVRDPSPVGFARASYELNLGCNFTTANIATWASSSSRA
jgi:hypothetical protein